MTRVAAAFCAGCGNAHCEVVMARAPSCGQQLVSRNSRWPDSAAAAWHWCVFRRQQACGGVAVEASAIGAIVPTSANNSRNLAVECCTVRCMAFSEAEPPSEGSIEQERERAQAEGPFSGRLESHSTKSALSGAPWHGRCVIPSGAVFQTEREIFREVQRFCARDPSVRS